MPHYKNTIRMLIGLLFLVIIFHILILGKVIPFTIVWGGRLKTEQEMIVFECISIAINLFLAGILVLKFRDVRDKWLDTVLWIFLFIFSVNTVGNLFAHTAIEKSFSGVTFLFAVLIGRILIKKK